MFPMATHGCGQWMSSVNIKDNNGFLLKILQKILRILWIWKGENCWHTSGPERWKKLSHIQRHDSEIELHGSCQASQCLKRTLREGVDPRKRDRGRPIREWIHDIEWTLGMKVHKTSNRQPVQGMLSRS